MRKLIFLTTIFSIVLFSLEAQQLAGAYFYQSEEGTVQLSLQYTDSGQLTGTMIDEAGAQYQLLAQETGAKASGTLTNATIGTVFVELSLKGNRLNFTFMPFDLMGKPDYNSTQTFVLAKKNNAAPSGALDVQSPQAGNTGWDGRFSGNIQGTPASLDLQSSDNQLSGQIDAGGYKYTLQGKITGNNSQGTLVDPQTNGQLQYEAFIEGTSVSFTILSTDPQTGQTQRLPLQFSKANASATTGSASASMQGGGGDMRLVGVWSYTESYSSGQFSGATQWKMQVNQDGTYLYGEGRFVGGGPGISGDSGGGGDVTRGKWKTQNNIIHIDEGSGWQPYARYYIEGYSLMLTFGDGSKQVWKRVN